MNHQHLVALGIVLSLGMFSQTNAQTTTTLETTSPAPTFAVHLTTRTVDAVNYRHHGAATKLDFRGTDLMPAANGEVSVKPGPPDQHQQPDRTRQEQRPQGDHVPQRTPDRGQEPQDRDRPGQPPQQAGSDDRSQRTPEFQHSQQRAWQQHRASHWESDHRTWRQRGGYDGYLIPDERFRGSFGRDHGFRIGVLPFRIVGGYPRFQYGGYWFSSVDPWPEYWGDDWYNTDDVYVDYLDNGYYLFNRRYPGSGVAISVSM